MTRQKIKTAADYQNYLKSHHWKRIKNRFYNTHRYRCYFCNRRQLLELHHVSYNNLYQEKPWDLVYLCGHHHDLVHNFTGVYFNLILKIRRFILFFNSPLKHWF